MSLEIKVPMLGESVVEGTIVRWMKAEGDSIEAGEPIVELETDKVNVELPSEQAGVLERILKREGETVKVGEAVALIADGTGTAKTMAPRAAAAQPSPNGGGREAGASPVAKKLAEEKQIDLSQVRGSGAGGRITKEDVAAHLETRQAPPPSPEPPPAPAPRIERTGGRVEERIRMSRRRQTIAARLVEAQHTAAMLTTFNEIDMSEVIAVRKRRQEDFQKQHGVKLGFMSFFTKAAIAGLKAFPNLNAEIQGDEIVQKRYYDIGIAVSTDEGLVVPVVRDADQKSFAEIEGEIGDLATRAREGKLTLPEIQGGTFTITNGGVFGSLMATPILNTPQVGILGMHRIQDRPVVVDGQIVIRPMMYVALSYDHRIVDGRESVQFLVRVKEMVEDPANLLIEG